jgi:glycosyltransferase involved in cell wall biosynthesis
LSRRSFAFSIVMPAYNAATTVRGAISSALAQDLADFELIVVDDGSTDETADAVSSFDDERIRLVRQENRGAAAARNAGIAVSTAPMVAFLDSDDFWMPTYLGAMQRHFGEAVETGLCYTDAWVVDPECRRVNSATAMQWQQPPDPLPDDPERLLIELLDRNFIYTAVTVRRDVLERLGPFDERLRAAIDYEMWLRAAARGYRFARLSGLHAVYRRGRPGSISSDRAHVWRSLGEVYRIACEELELPPGVLPKARERLAAVRREAAASEGEGGLDGLWRSRLRPAIVAGRNVALRRDRWRSTPPRELLDVLPQLAGAPASALRRGRRFGD